MWRFVRFTIRDHKYMYFGILHFVTPINSSLKIHFSLDHCIKVLYIASIPHPSSLNTNLHTCIILYWESYTEAHHFINFFQLSLWLDDVCFALAGAIYGLEFLL